MALLHRKRRRIETEMGTKISTHWNENDDFKSALWTEKGEFVNITKCTSFPYEHGYAVIYYAFDKNFVIENQESSFFSVKKRVWHTKGDTVMED